MGDKDTKLRNKVIDAFKGFVKSYRLEPLRERTLHKDREYLSPLGLTLFNVDGEPFDLFYRRKEWAILLDLVERLYPDQVDRKAVQRLLIQTVTDWIEQGYDRSDQSQLEQEASRFLDQIESQFGEFVVYVPIDGLQGDFPQGLALGRCQVYRNSRDSELVRLLRADRERLGTPDEHLASVEQASAYMKMRVSAHSARADSEAKREAQLALDILRLFRGSYYRDVYQRPVAPRRMGLIGTLPEGKHSPVFRIRDNVPIEQQFPGGSLQFAHYRPFELDARTVEAMNDIALARINRLVCPSEMDSKNDIAPRLLRSINWFAKATTADSIGNSFLMYAISVESLLSEGRTRKETYAKHIAALVTREDQDGSHPLCGASVSPRFHKKLTGTSQDELFGAVHARVVELFGIRNDVVHGRLMDREIDPLDLVDFETLVRCSILSFVDFGWSSLDQFKRWLRRR